MVDEEFWKTVKKGTGVVIKEDSVKLPEDQTATESLSDFARFLFEEGYLSESDLPIESGWSRYLLNTEPTHSDGEEMRRDVEILSGVFLERNYNREGIKRKIQQLHRLIQDKKD